MNSEDGGTRTLEIQGGGGSGYTPIGRGISDTLKGIKYSNVHRRYGPKGSHTLFPSWISGGEDGPDSN